jgi:hypothetical protein
MFTQSKWEPVGQNQVWDFATEGPDSYFFGIFIDKQEDLGENKSTIYNFIRYKDEDFTQRMGPWSIWGTSLLDTRFKNFTKGEQVAVKYLGRTPSEKRKGKEYHNFKVDHRPMGNMVDVSEPADDNDFDEEFSKTPF